MKCESKSVFRNSFYATSSSVNPNLSKMITWRKAGENAKASQLIAINSRQYSRHCFSFFKKNFNTCYGALKRCWSISNRISCNTQFLTAMWLNWQRKLIITVPSSWIPNLASKSMASGTAIQSNRIEAWIWSPHILVLSRARFAGEATALQAHAIPHHVISTAIAVGCRRKVCLNIPFPLSRRWWKSAAVNG